MRSRQETPDSSAIENNTYHEVFASVEVSEVVRVTVEDESLVVKIVFVSVHGMDETRSNGHTSDNFFPVRH
jgi:hypothetical protein